ncbi:MAG TPA: histidine--tRNA ligase [candidate division Zixibacteria bacterium]|nr:histidine--tRNA ligase [candidate division Zixibacteria bacterium]
MSKPTRPKPRVYKGLRDIFAPDLIARREVIETIRVVYERYGFAPLETPALEYVDCLGKFLPESHTPEGGIFAFRNPDLSAGTRDNHPDWWLGMRYDLTAPLARVVAQYQQDLPRPFRRYQIGPVWRFEKPGPGRFREFIQFDFDTVGSSSMLADAEACMIFCDALTALGFAPGEFLVKVNNRKALQGALDACGLTEADITDESSKVGIALRAIDKLDRIGLAGVRQLLSSGRTDESGDVATGANLTEQQIAIIEQFLQAGAESRSAVCDNLEALIGSSTVGAEGVGELRQIDEFLTAAGYDSSQVVFDPTVVRGLGYYTGPVFEGVITREIIDENGKTRDFGSVFGGGRYDSLVERFTGQKVPATGASVGVDRLMEAVKLLHKPRPRSTAQVLVTVMDKSRLDDYITITQQIRSAGVNTETFLGSGSIGKQLQYADRRGIPLAVIAGSDEFTRGEFQVKDLELGRELAAGIEDRDQWRKGRPSQQSVPAERLVDTLKELLAHYYQR